MKKTLLLTATLILTAIASWAQNALSFTIYPTKTGPFTIFYSTYNTPSTNAMQVDWGDGQLKIENGKAETGSDPSKVIQGTVTAGIPIKLYSNCIDAILIESYAKSIRCDGNNPQLQYIYYLKDDLSSVDLEALYMSLIDRNGKTDWGELHLSKALNVTNAGPNILKSNAFAPIKKKWHVCSWKEWTGSFANRTNWHLTEAVATANLIPAITLQTTTTANMTDLQLGIKDSPQLPWIVNTSLIRIDDGTTNHQFVEVSRYSTNDEFGSNAPKKNVKGTGTTGEVKIYGAMVSHIKTNDIRSLNINNLTNLRYLLTNNSNYITDILGINQQKSLNYLDLSGNVKLTNVNVNISPELKTLTVKGCSSLKELWFVRLNLEFLDISKCVSLPVKKISLLNDATKLNKIYAENLGWNACDLDALYYSLGQSPPAPGLISVEDAAHTTISNDFGGSNKTIATAKGWNVSRYADGWIPLSGNGGGCITGISQTEAAKFITVFPNPATDIVNITLVPTLKAESLEVIDISGKTIFSVPVSPNELEFKINVSGYAKGMYLIRVGHFTQKLLVK